MLLDKLQAFKNKVRLSSPQVYNAIQAASIVLNGHDVELTFPFKSSGEYDFIFRKKKNLSALERAACSVLGRGSCVKLDLLASPPPSPSLQKAVDLVIEVLGAEPLTVPSG